MRNRSREQLEAMVFKPTAGGFVYRAPAPWVFGQASNYLVDDAQKSEILAIMTPDVPAWRRAAVIGAIIGVPILWVCAVTALVWALSGHDEPTAGDFVAVLLLVLVPLVAMGFAALAWNAQVQLAKLAPIIARLAPSGDAITRTDLRRGMIRATSFGSLLAVILIFSANALVDAFALGMAVAQHRLATLSTALVTFNLVVALVMIAMYAGMVLKKAKGQVRAEQG